MAERVSVERVYLSTALDLERLFAGAFAPHGEAIRLRTPDEEPASIRFALCWHPAADAFRPYPNLKLAASIADPTRSRRASGRCRSRRVLEISQLAGAALDIVAGRMPATAVDRSLGY